MHDRGGRVDLALEARPAGDRAILGTPHLPMPPGPIRRRVHITWPPHTATTAPAAITAG
jgi:hypothetical protein